MTLEKQKKLYIFLDEGGNFDFTETGSKYFLLSCVSLERPFSIFAPIDSLRYDCIEYGLPQEYFHCSDDNQHVRSRMFDVILQYLDQIKIDSLIVEKRKTGPSLQDPKQFYPTMLGYLIRYVIAGKKQNSFSEVIVITDLIPINKKRDAVEKAVKMTLAEMLPENVRYRILHHASKAHYGLQVADYCNWAVLRKWERGDHQYYEKIKPALRSEFDIFQNGLYAYY